MTASSSVSTARIDVAGGWRFANDVKALIANPWCSPLIRLTDTFNDASTQFFRKRGISAAYMPITTNSISSPMGLGSDSSPVKIDLEGVSTYLADSMQFMLELACRFQPDGAFYIMPSFRGEAADARHLCQFYHSEAEIPGDLDQVIELIEAYVLHLTTVFMEEREADLTAVAGATEHLEAVVANSSFPRIPLAEARRRLERLPGALEVHPNRSVSVTAVGEKELMQQVGGPLWLTHADRSTVPFYQAADPADERNALTADLLMGIGETVGAGQRHQTAAEVYRALAQHEVDPDSYHWYVDMKTCSPMLTGGFGMGVERFFLWLTAHDDIRDMQLLQRFNGEVSTP